MSRRRPLTVVQSFPGGGANTNPYLLQLVDALRRSPDDVDVRTFSWRRAILGRYDVLHVHWPERFVRGERRLGTAAKRMRFAVLLARLTVTRTRVVRTLHNVDSHESGDAVERLLLGRLEALTSLRIRLNPFTPVAEGEARTILHGHYRDWTRASRAARVPGRLLFFGLLRPYKGVEELVAAFRGLPDPDASLRVVGHVQDAALGAALRREAEQDARVDLVRGYVGDAALAEEIARAQLVVLPYRAVHNSGAALLALSLGRPVLMPATDTTRWLRDEVGADWVRLFDGDLDAVVLGEALASTAAEPGRAPAMRQRDWAPIAAQHLEAYRAALAAR